MSRCFYVKCEDGFVNLEAVQENTQEVLNEGYTVKMEEYEPTEGQGGCFYIEGESSRGVHVYKEDDNILVKINILCNYSDYVVARIILDMFSQVFEQDVLDDENEVINVREYFTDEKIQKLREEDANNFYTVLKTVVEDNIQIPGLIRSVYFGKNLTKILSNHENDPKAMVAILDMTMQRVQYALPDFNMPGVLLVRPQDSDNEKDFKKIRVMSEGHDYILQDYDYLAIYIDDENADTNKKLIFIDNKDLIEIISQIDSEYTKMEVVDDFTVVFPKLEGKEWQKFVELARPKNHKELLD